MPDTVSKHDAQTKTKTENLLAWPVLSRAAVSLRNAVLAPEILLETRSIPNM